MMKTIFTFLAVIASFAVSAQIVNIPDANFKQRLLLWHNEIDTNHDNEIQVSEAENFTGRINIQGSPNYPGFIKDLTGIEAFINLTELYCPYNQLTTLDISKNTKLKTLWCESNQLTSLDVSKNILLQWLDFSSNELSTIDISKNPFLTTLLYNYNQINNLDHSKYPQLIAIGCFGNNLTSLDISKNLNLKSLRCGDNQLTSLDISKNILLEYLDFKNNQISNINTFEHSFLKVLLCESNLLKNIDVSKNAELIALACNNNQLISLNLKNGQNEKIEFFISIWNADLTCIQVDDVSYFNTHWSQKDSWATYSTDCSLGVNDITKSAIQIYPNPVKDKFIIDTNNKIENIEIYSQTGQLLKTVKSKEVNISNFPKGNYLVKIKTDKDNINQKIIKE